LTRFVRRSDAAELDLQEIAFQIAFTSRRPKLADVIIDELIAECEKLAELSATAKIGTHAPELGRDIRLFSYKRWVIIFRYEPHGIDVLRIADGSQEYLFWKLV